MRKCPHKKEPGRSKCRECRRAPGTPPRPSRLKKEGRPRGKRRESVYACLTEEEWRKLWALQGGRCAMCDTPLKNRYDPGSPGKDSKIAQLDHSHFMERQLIALGYDARAALRGSLRGLLCYHDNRYVLHALRDSPEKADRAGSYLRLPPALGLFSLRDLPDLIEPTLEELEEAA